MKKIYFILAVLCSSFYLSSCEQNELVDSPPSMKFNYQGNLYTSNYQVVNGKTTYSNDGVAKIQEKLSQNLELATLVSEDGSCIYFDNYEALTNYLKQKEMIESNTIPTTRAGANTCTIGLYANTKYKGTKKIFTSSSAQKSAAYSDLSTLGLLNAISSIKINTNYFNYVDNGGVTLWENKNFSGRSITWRTTRNSNNPINIPNLENYALNLPPLLPKSWNDAAQSAQVGF